MRTSTTAARRRPLMPSKASTSSTDSLVSSSAGVSRNPCIRRWGPNLFQVIETSGVDSGLHLFVKPHTQAADLEHWISFHWLGTSNALELPESTQGRLLCHLLLMQLPDEGVQ